MHWTCSSCRRTHHRKATRRPAACLLASCPMLSASCTKTTLRRPAVWSSFSNTLSPIPHPRLCGLAGNYANPVFDEGTLSDPKTDEGSTSHPVPAFRTLARAPPSTAPASLRAHLLTAILPTHVADILRCSHSASVISLTFSRTLNDAHDHRLDDLHDTLVDFGVFVDLAVLCALRPSRSQHDTPASLHHTRELGSRPLLTFML
mmetsp:Transcript_103180/g.268717  ORF Transcript_103180/g.268717 Transcript_103180/m.268717 type:complete len:204 (-) Transcript_103180:15-626(-)